MAEQSFEEIHSGSDTSYWWPTNGIGDGKTSYTEDDWALFLRSVLTTAPDAQGVVPGYGSQLSPGVSGSNATVQDGAAVVNGKLYFNTTPLSINIPSSTGTRYDRIVLRQNTTSDWVGDTPQTPGYTVRVGRIAGVDGGGVPPLPPNTPSQWVIPLATVRMTGSVLTLHSDDRQYVFFRSRVNTADNQTVEYSGDMLRVKDLGITENKLAAGAVSSAKIATSAVIEGKIANAAVTAAKIADGSVTTPKLADAAVTTAKIADGSVTATKLDTALSLMRGQAAKKPILHVVSGGPLVNGEMRYTDFEVAYSATPVVLFYVWLNGPWVYPPDLYATWHPDTRQLVQTYGLWLGGGGNTVCLFARVMQSVPPYDSYWWSFTGSLSTVVETGRVGVCLTYMSLGSGTVILNSGYWALAIGE